MQKFIKQLYILFLAFFCMINLNAQKLDHVLGEILIEVRNDNGLKSLIQDLSSNATMRSSLKAKKIMSEPMNLWVLKANPNEVNEIHFLEKVMRNNHVLLAQQNHITQLREIPDDPNFTDQWQYINTGQSGGLVGADIDMDLAWDVATGGLTTDGDTIVVCVIDDGINLNHADFGDNLWVNHREIAGNEIDDDGNGYIDDVRGWNAYIDTDDVTVDGSHGTPVAGIVGAQGNNGIGVAGVNWDVKLMIVRGGSPEATALASYAYPYTMRKMYNETNGEKGAFVVSTNASWGIDFGDPEDAPIWCEFYNMLGEVGILNFGATINGNVNVDVEGDLPTACESNYLVSVTNMNRQDEKVTGAGFGRRHIDLGAFGAQTYTLTYNSYGGFGGTSGATPHVTGTAALLYSADCPDFIAFAKSNPAQAALVIKDCILHGVDSNETLRDITTTGGRLNANNSIRNLISSCSGCSDAFGGYIEDLTDKSGVITWYDNENVGSTSIRYKRLIDEDWIEIESVESGYKIEGLIACSSYEFQTKTDCESNPTAEYTYSRVFKTDGCCEVPSGINILLEDQIATIQWEDVLAANNFVVEWKRIGDSDWNMLDIGLDNTFVIENILDCEFYEVRIKSQCEVTNNESEFSEIFIINGECDGCTNEFCDFDIKNINDEWIETVEIENVFFNESGVNENGYGSFLGQFDINLETEEEYTINLSPGYTGPVFDEYFSAYIDFNQNGEFEEDENIFRSQQPTQITVSDTFTIPSNAISGATRMRVIMRFNELNGPCDESDFEFGEIEDYCVNVINNTNCPNTFSAIVTDTSKTTITFEILPNGLAEFYLIGIREKGAPIFDIITSQLNEILISDLQVCTEYEYSSGYICGGETLIDTEVFDIFTLCELNTNNIQDLPFSIFPNPSYGNLNIDFEGPVNEDVKLELISNDGKIALTKNVAKNGEKAFVIDANNIPPGIYFLSATSKNHFTIKKWIKY